MNKPYRVQRFWYSKRRRICIVVFLILLAPVVGMALARFGMVPETAKKLRITGRDLTAVTVEEKELVDTFITELTPSPTVTISPIAKGKQTYFVRSSNTVGPKIAQVDISELDPKAGSEQSFSVTVTPAQSVAISSVSVVLTTDTTTTVHILKQESKTEEQEIWKGTWMVSDTHNKIYSAAVHAADKNGKANIEITVR